VIKPMINQPQVILPFLWPMMNDACYIYIYLYIPIWLVVYLPLLKNMKVSWDCLLYGKIKNVPNHQPELIDVGSICHLLFRWNTSTGLSVLVGLIPWGDKHKSPRSAGTSNL
jgi:hypothetical protein